MGLSRFRHKRWEQNGSSIHAGLHVQKTVLLCFHRVFGWYAGFPDSRNTDLVSALDLLSGSREAFRITRDEQLGDLQ